jgi:hypothetical protein
MLVICSLPEIYAKFKARWLEQRKVTTSILDTTTRSLSKSKIDKQTCLWNRLNHDKLTPLTLAADLSRTQMLSWLLHERKIVQWSYGDVSCILHPLDQLDIDFNDGVSLLLLDLPASMFGDLDEYTESECPGSDRQEQR